MNLCISEFSKIGNIYQDISDADVYYQDSKSPGIVCVATVPLGDIRYYFRWQTCDVGRGDTLHVAHSIAYGDPVVGDIHRIHIFSLG